MSKEALGELVNYIHDLRECAQRQGASRWVYELASGIKVSDMHTVPAFGQQQRIQRPPFYQGRQRGVVCMAEVTNINDAYSWNITRIAEAFNFSRDTVRKRLREAGVRPSGKRSGHPIYSLEEAARALFDGEARTDVPDFQDPDKMPPKARKEWFQSENERVKFMTDAKQLIPETEHRQDLYNGFSQVVSFFENLPDKMERTGLFTPEQLELLETEGDNFRAQLYVMVKEVEPDGQS